MNYLFRGECINYEFCGGKLHTILFLHGWGGNKFSFAKTMELFKKNFNVLSLTMPTTSPTNLVWNLHLFAELVENLLMLHNIQICFVVCHSFGFRVASLMKKNLIKAIVVTGGAGLRTKNIFARIERENKTILSRNSKFKALHQNLASMDYVSLSKINQQTFKNIVNLNTLPCTKFNCPILLFWGKNDTETPLWIAKKVQKINKCKLIVTKGNHFAYLQQNALFNNALLGFFNDIVN